MQDPFEQREERRARLIFVALTFTAGLLLGGYFVIMKTRHDGDTARDTARVAIAVEYVASEMGHRHALSTIPEIIRQSEVRKLHKFNQSTCGPIRASDCTADCNGERVRFIRGLSLGIDPDMPEVCR